MNKTNKIISTLLLTCMLVVLLCACSEGKPNGKYNMYEMESTDGQMESVDAMIKELKEEGIDYNLEAYIEFNSDKTGKIYMTDSVDEQFTWDDNYIYVGDESLPYTHSGSKITITGSALGGGRKMVFSK